MDPMDFIDENNNMEKLRDLLREYILTSSRELQDEPVRTHRIRKYIGTGQTVEVNETDIVQYGSTIYAHDAFTDTDAGTALSTYLYKTHNFKPSTSYLNNLLQHAFSELDAVTLAETEPKNEGIQRLQVAVNDGEALQEVVNEALQILTADIHEQYQYTLRLALTGPIIEQGTIEINDTHRLRGLDDGLLLGRECVRNTETQTGHGTNVKSWTATAEIDMSTQHPFNGEPGTAAEFLAIVLSVFSRSWIAVKNAYSVKRTFHNQMNLFPPGGKTDATLTELKPKHGPRINELLQLLRQYCDASTTLDQASPFFIHDLFSPPINLALHHYGEALIRSELPQSSTGRVLFGLESVCQQHTEGHTSARDVARYAAFTIAQATSHDVHPERVLTDIDEAYNYRNKWAHGERVSEIHEDLQNRMFDYLRYAIVVFAWVDTHTNLMTPHLDIESAFINEADYAEFIDRFNEFELTDYLRVLPSGQVGGSEEVE